MPQKGTPQISRLLLCGTENPVLKPECKGLKRDIPLGVRDMQIKLKKKKRTNRIATHSP